MTRTGWILLFALFAVCVYASVGTEHMTTAGYTLGPSTNVGDTSYADMLKADTGRGVGYGAPPGTTDNLPPESATRPTCPSGKTFNDSCKCCVDGPGNMSAATCPPGSGLWGGQCVAGRPPAPDNYWLPGGGPPPPFPQEPPHNLPPESATRPTCPSGKTFNDSCKCCVDGPGNMSAATCPPGSGLWGGQCVAGRPPAPDNYWLPGGGPPPPFPQEPPQCPPNQPFVSGKGCVGSNGKTSKPICFGNTTYTPDFEGKTIGQCSAPTGSMKPSNSRPPPRYTSEGTPAKVTPAALTGLQVGGPNDGGIGQSTGSGNASWGGSGVKYPNLLGPDNKKSNLPDNNMTANLVLPTPCQVGADGNTLYSPGCRAPTDLGYFTLPAIPKMEGNPSPFSEDYTVFMK
jgi:hypothetical protein